MSWFKRKKDREYEVEPEELSEFAWMTIDEALAYSRGERGVNDETLVRLTGELCDQIGFLRDQQEEAKYELKQVTQYVADIQRLERMNESERAEIMDAARMVVSLDAERTRFQKGPRNISDTQYHTMELYENEVEERIEELNKQEEYLSLIRQDMHSLEGEKGSIRYNIESAENKRSFLGKFSFVVVAMTITIFIVLIMLMNSTKKDFAVPFFITGVAAIGYAVYYVYTIGALSTTIKKNEYMLNRANVLLNKVKIKFVNTTNSVEYSYEKYGVNSLQELEYVWNNFLKQKEEEKKYRKNTQMLSAHGDRLEEALKRIGIEKADAWVHQPELLLDRGEMADFKDAVSLRRNKLRAQIDYNIRQQDNVRNELENLRNKYSDRINIINAIVLKNNIE